MLELNEFHRELLRMRTYLSKFAIQVDYKDSPEILSALNDLIQHKYVTKIDTYFNLEVHRFLDVYQLTKEGENLVEIERIPAKNP